MQSNMIDSGTLHYYGGIIWHMGLGTYEWQMGFVAQGILFRGISLGIRMGNSVFPLRKP